ncbi:MAG TPA: CPBP family intramembrane glutamic endopeptidase [Chlamydiales bacterium]|jgi:hypothetical protein|nr:CPBP family intramembrane glutamic endopeptidase [Chlamydiales bacterium]
MNINQMAQIFLLGVVAFAVLWFGKYKGFFRWNPNRLWDTSLGLKNVLIAFALYFGITNILGPPLYESMKPFFQNQIGLLSWFNFTYLAFILVGLLIYCRTLNKATLSNVWRNTHLAVNYREDFLFAFYAWTLSFPLVLFVSLFLESFVLLVFNVPKLPDQIAVYFVKMTFSDPVYFSLAIVTVVLMAPLIEETLFRGFLQSFIRKHLGPKQAILITAICFSWFHYAPDQGLGNIPILGSLFALALFLGFLYEKQGSLFASIALHSLFNAISILNLYFLGGILSPL